MQYPVIQFVSWVKWKDRESIRGCEEPGVYALLRSAAVRSLAVDTLDERIVYFGETCGQSLRQRWRQFEDSAFQQKSGHSGGKTYRSKYQGDDVSDLYLSAMPVKLNKEIENDAIRHSFIRFAERKLILDYAMKWKRRPDCNMK